MNEHTSFARRVIVESPYAGDTEKHIAYAQEALRDCFARGESPFASHLLYTQILNDAVPAQRQWGITAGLQWGICAHATVVYTDCGISKGMQEGIRHAERLGRLVEFRTLPGWTAIS